MKRDKYNRMVGRKRNFSISPSYNQKRWVVDGCIKLMFSFGVSFLLRGMLRDRQHSRPQIKRIKRALCAN